MSDYRTKEKPNCCHGEDANSQLAASEATRSVKHINTIIMEDEILNLRSLSELKPFGYYKQV